MLISGVSLVKVSSGSATAVVYFHFWSKQIKLHHGQWQESSLTKGRKSWTVGRTSQSTSDKSKCYDDCQFFRLCIAVLPGPPVDGSTISGPSFNAQYCCSQSQNWPERNQNRTSTQGRKWRLWDKWTSDIWLKMMKFDFGTMLKDCQILLLSSI